MPISYQRYQVRPGDTPDSIAAHFKKRPGGQSPNTTVEICGGSTQSYGFPWTTASPGRRNHTRKEGRLVDRSCVSYRRRSIMSDTPETTTFSGRNCDLLKPAVVWILNSTFACCCT